MKCKKSANYRYTWPGKDETVVKTAYGVSSKKQTVNIAKEMLEESGFKVEIIENKNKLKASEISWG